MRCRRQRSDGLEGWKVGSGLGGWEEKIWVFRNRGMGVSVLFKKALCDGTHPPCFPVFFVTFVFFS